MPEQWLVPVVVPQLEDQFRHEHIVGVLAHKPEYKDAVLAEILLAELDRHLLVQLGLVAVVDTQELLEVAQSVLAEYHRVDPDEEVERAESGDEHQPEPDEDEDFLVEQVDGQHALHRVVVHVGQLADLEEAMRDSRELGALRPALAAGQMVDHLEAVHVKVRAEEFVENEELADGVAQVEQLDEHVERDEVVAVALAPHDAAVLGDLLT